MSKEFNINVDGEVVAVMREGYRFGDHHTVKRSGLWDVPCVILDTLYGNTYMFDNFSDAFRWWRQDTLEE